LGELFKLNPEAQEHPLLIPVYKTTKKIIAEQEKYSISREDFDMTLKFYKFLCDKITLVKYDCEPKVLEKAKETFEHKEKYYDFNESNSLFEPELILGRIFDYLCVKAKELEGFKQIENEIVHFKRIELSDGAL